MKKNLKITENFFQESLFTLNSYACTCAIDTINISPTEVKRVFKVLSNIDKPIKFAFQPKVGLVRLSPNGSVEDDNVLGHLLAIKDNDIKGYMKFFEKNGFFYKTTDNEYEEIDDTTLMKFITRLKSTVKLMEYIGEIQRKDYKAMLTLTLYLLLSPNETLKIGNNEYKTCNHMTLQETIERGLYKKFDAFNQNPDEDYNIKIKDSIYGSYKIHMDIARHYEMDDDIFTTKIKKIIHSYFADQDSPKNNRIIAELIFHICHDISPFYKVTPYEISFNNSDVNWDKYDEKLKDATLEVAKIVLGEEINSNVNGIKPEYDINILEPRWKVDSLMSALYFSIFYIRLNSEIPRQCRNPRCNTTFVIPRTSTRKIYCCPECAKKACINRYRANKKKLLESN